MYRFLKGAMLAAGFVVAFMPSVFADGPYATYEIKLDASHPASEMMAIPASPTTKDKVSFHIINNTGKAIYFNNNDGEFIPLVSNSTVTVPYHNGEQYKAVDAEGNLVAEWTLAQSSNQSQAEMMALASEQKYAEWDRILKQVIENQKVAYQEEPATKPEPRYYASNSVATRKSVSYASKSVAPRKAVSRKAIIRGYW